MAVAQNGGGGGGLAHQFSLPKTSSEMAAIEKFLQFQDAVPCKIRAKRGCATHPRSIAERVRTVPYTRAHLSPPRARHGMAWRGVAWRGTRSISFDS